MTVRVHDVDADLVIVDSPTTLRAQLPPNLGTVGAVSIFVGLPYTGAGRRFPNAFSYSASEMCFQSLAEVPTGVPLTNLLSGDFNGDGRTDFAASVRDQAALQILRTPIGPVATAATLGTVPRLLLGADFNGDGRTDVVAVDGSTQAVYRTDASYGFTETNRFTSPTSIDQVVVGDFNGDLRQDLLFFSAATATARIHALGPDGTFGASSPPLSLGSARIIAALDLDQDGVSDLVSIDAVGDAAAYFGGRGAGLSPGVSWSLATGGAATSFALGDLNKDGRADLVLSDSSTLLRALLSRGRDLPSLVRSELAAVPQRLLLADIDGDTYPDLVAVVGTGDRVMLYRGLGLGRFGQGFTMFSGLPVTAMVAADHGGHSLPDLMLISDTSYVPVRNCSR